APPEFRLGQGAFRAAPDPCNTASHGIFRLTAEGRNPYRECGLAMAASSLQRTPAVDIFLVVNPRKRFNRAESLFIEAMRDRIRPTPIKQPTYV
ncbi:MAG: hypothetical protein O3A08_14115, partial [Proteobacteria bacterium]|nr:hypothetical protein [Pseudomonadota bacterium]